MENNIFIQFIAGFVVSASFGIFFNAPKKSVFTCGLIGAIGWLVHVMTNLLLVDGAVCVGVLSTNASRILKLPATIFIYTGMVPLVPGYGMYNTMQNIVTKNYGVASQVGIETILQAGAIAMGILLASVFSSSIQRVKIQRKR